MNRRKQRKIHQQFNPLGFADAEFEEIKLQDFDEDLVESVSIIDKLQSFNPSEREMATISLSQIDHFSAEFMSLLHEKGALKLLVERLVDPNPQIVLNSIVALTNITSSGSQIQQGNIGDVIMDNGILILLETLLSDFKRAHEQRQIDTQKSDFEIKMAIINSSYKLLSSLAEYVSTESLDIVLHSKVTEISLYFLMNCDEARILTGIGSFLQVLTESSVKLCEKIGENLDVLKRLANIVESTFATQELKAYILGSLFNYICTLERNGIQPQGREELCPKVMNEVLNIIGVKIFDEIENLIKIIEDNKKKLTGSKNQNGHANHNETIDLDPVNHEEILDEETKDMHETPVNDTVHDIRLKQALNIWGDSATAIQICLGIVLNIFESEEGYEDEWKDDGDEDEQNDELNNPKLNKYEPSSTSFMVNMTQELREKILGTLFDKCQHLSVKIHDEFLSTLKPIADQSKAINEFAFSCISNILLNIEYTDKKNNTKYVDTFAEQLFKLSLEEWKYYLEVLYQNSTEEESEDKEDVTFEQNVINDILKVVIDLLQTSTLNLASLLDVSDLIKVQATTFKLLSEESRLSTIELIGVRCHPKFGLTFDENALVADFLQELLKADDVMIIGEGLNALFDVYSDEAYDEIFVQKGFMNMLTFGYNVFKNKIAENKTVLSQENYALVRNHLLNLRRFIKYKQEHIKQ